MPISGLVFLATFFTLMGMALLRHPRYGLYAYVAVFYLHPPSRWWGEFLPDLRWSLLAAFVTLLATWRLRADEDMPERPSWASSLGAKLLIAYTLWLWLQNLWALDPPENLEASILFTKYVILFYLVYRLVDSTIEMRRFLLLHVIGCFYLGWLAWGAEFSGRLEGVGGPGIDEANVLAMHLGTAVMCGAMLVLVAPWKVRLVVIVAIPFILNGMVLAGSRGAILAMLVGALALVRLKPPSYRKAFYSLGVLALVLFGMLANEMFWERMDTIKVGLEDESQMDTSAFSRFVMLEAQVKMALAYPMGTGHRGTAVLSPLYIDEKYMAADSVDSSGQRSRSSHNTFMTAWVEQGFPGAAMFILMCLWSWRSVRRLRRLQKDGDAEPMAQTAALAAALLLAFFAGMFVDYLKAEVQIWLLALIASQLAMEMQKDVADSHMTEESVTESGRPSRLAVEDRGAAFRQRAS
ncbi:MAG: O-antigen ligase family protein [Gammaproteobacteria bacterium]|nr:O-antigen ligase family protein [Gammaproteobacteria bacterium]